MQSEHWHTRPMRCEFGVGTGTAAGTFSIVLGLPEWRGPFGSPAEDEARRRSVSAAAVAAAAERFRPGERIVLLKMLPVATRVRPAWDR